MDTDVLIVGAGPVGLTLAVDLGNRGIRCTLIEQKSAPHMWPKMERCNARTMELYRRLGIVEKIRAAGLPSRPWRQPENLGRQPEMRHNLRREDLDAFVIDLIGAWICRLEMVTFTP